MNLKQLFEWLDDGNAEKYGIAFINLHEATKAERLEFIINHHDRFRLCNGCDCLIFDTHYLCPYCVSYNFKKVDEDFVLKLTEDSKHIDYPIPLE